MDPKDDADGVTSVAGAVAARRRYRLSKPRKSHIAVMLVSLATGSAATVTALESWDKILVALHLKQSESALLAQSGQQGDLLRQMTRTISQRIFWSVRYGGDLEYGFPQADLDEAWKRYNDSVIAYNGDYTLYIVLTKKYFNKESTEQLTDLHRLLLAINMCLNRIHYPQVYQKKDPACHFNLADGSRADGGSEQDNIRVLDDALDQASLKFKALADLLSK